MSWITPGWRFSEAQRAESRRELASVGERRPGGARTPERDAAVAGTGGVRAPAAVRDIGDGAKDAWRRPASAPDGEPPRRERSGRLAGAAKRGGGEPPAIVQASAEQELGHWRWREGMSER
ncbi:MAG: hypothetical protein PHR35_13570 [Kiritimatiellae bacterium]|nr:hypothetical protein [Kiritimatiellia bacterium]